MHRFKYLRLMLAEIHMDVRKNNTRLVCMPFGDLLIKDHETEISFQGSTRGTDERVRTCSPSLFCRKHCDEENIKRAQQAYPADILTIVIDYKIRSSARACWPVMLVCILHKDDMRHTHSVSQGSQNKTCTSRQRREYLPCLLQRCRHVALQRVILLAFGLYKSAYTSAFVSSLANANTIRYSLMP